MWRIVVKIRGGKSASDEAKIMSITSHTPSVFLCFGSHNSSGSYSTRILALYQMFGKYKDYCWQIHNSGIEICEDEKNCTRLNRKKSIICFQVKDFKNEIHWHIHYPRSMLRCETKNCMGNIIFKHKNLKKNQFDRRKLYSTG